jgi:hypothetical protein
MVTLIQAKVNNCRFSKPVSYSLDECHVDVIYDSTSQWAPGVKGLAGRVKCPTWKGFDWRVDEVKEGE